ncbi:hypothetical protein AB7G19_16285 [Bradyrhizobium sp. 215_C5_N1_1]
MPLPTRASFALNARCRPLNDTKLVTTPRMVEDFHAYMQKKRH